MDEQDRSKHPGNSYSKIKPRYLTENREAEAEQKSRALAKGHEAKPTFKDRLLSTIFIPTAEEIRDRVIFNWVIPGLKNIANDLIDMVIFPGNRGSVRRESLGGGSTTRSYNSIYNGGKSQTKDGATPSITHRPVIEFETYEEANRVLRQLQDDISVYKAATMKDFYQYADMDSITNRQMDNVGWRNLDGVEPEQIRGGMWRIQMPRVEEIRR